MKKSICAVIITGAIWGICEATAGHILHVFMLGLGWMIWYPMAFFFLDTVYQVTKKPYCMLCCAVISAGLKMINLIHTPRIDFVVNPAVSIILEALAAYAVYTWLAKRGNAADSARMSFVNIITASVLWRSAYICCLLLFMPESWIEISCLSDTVQFARFFFLETMANATFIYMCALVFRGLKTANTLKKIHFRHIGNRVFKPIPTILILAMAVVIRIKL